MRENQKSQNKKYKKKSTGKSFSHSAKRFLSKNFNTRYSPSAPKFIAIPLIAFLIIGLGVWASVPTNGVFHSYKSQPIICNKTLAPSAPCNDPTTLIWQRTQGIPADLTDFNLGNGGTYTYGSPCFNGLSPSYSCINTTALSNNASVAITKNPIGDLGIANSKTLAFLASYYVGNLGTNAFLNDPWGFFLTTNNTAPQHDIGNNIAYSPLDDPNVIAVVEIYCITPGTFGCLGGCVSSCTAPTYQVIEYINTKINQKVAISSQPFSCGSQTSSSACIQTFVDGDIGRCITNCNNNNNRGFWSPVGIYLNYTGATRATTTCSVVSNLFDGAGCSWLFSFNAQTATILSSDAQGVSTLVPNIASINNIYLGFWNTIPADIPWIFVGNDPSIVVGGNTGMDSFSYVPNPSCTGSGTDTTNYCPNFDTGGFFGPIIKLFLSAGVFIAQNLITFGSFLSGIFVPTIITIFNVMGNFFGLGNVGTNLSNFFNGIESWFVNIFGNAIGQLGNIATQGGNLVNLIVNLFTFSNLSNLIIQFLANIGLSIPLLDAFFNDIITLFSSFSQFAVFMFFLWYLWLGVAIYFRGYHGVMREFELMTKFLTSLFHGGYYFAKESWYVLLSIKQFLTAWI